MDRIVGFKVESLFQFIYVYISVTCGWNGQLVDYTGVNKITSSTYEYVKDAIGQITSRANKGVTDVEINRLVEDNPTRPLLPSEI